MTLRPKSTATSVRITFVAMLRIASVGAIRQDWTAKVEKVVNEPKKPIPNPIRTRGLIYPWNSVSYISIPSAKLPSTLTVSISKDVTIVLDNKNLEIAPKKPPVPIIDRLVISVPVKPISIDQDNINVLPFFIPFHVFRDYNKPVGFCH